MTMLLDRWRANRGHVRLAGEIAIARAHAAGVGAYYRDAATGGIVREDTDGRRHPVDLSTMDSQNLATAAPAPRR